MIFVNSNHSQLALILPNWSLYGFPVKHYAEKLIMITISLQYSSYDSLHLISPPIHPPTVWHSIFLPSSHGSPPDRLNLPSVLVLNGCGISRAGDQAEIAAFCAHVVELDLSHNKLHDWHEVLTLGPLIAFKGPSWSTNPGDSTNTTMNVSLY